MFKSIFSVLMRANKVIRPHYYCCRFFIIYMISSRNFNKVIMRKICIKSTSGRSLTLFINFILCEVRSLVNRIQGKKMMFSLSRSDGNWGLINWKVRAVYIYVCKCLSVLCACSVKITTSEQFACGYYNQMIVW